MSQSYSSLCGDFFAAQDKREEMKALEAIHSFTHHVELNQHGVSRSKAGDNLVAALSSVETRTLDRTVTVANRNQSFSVSRKSLRVKTSQTDKRLLHMRTDAEKMLKAANMKRQNNRQPSDAIVRIEKKISELLVKLEKATRQGTDKTALDALLVRCNYYRHREIVRLAELQVKGDARDALPTTGSADCTVKPSNLATGYINQYGRTIPNGGINVPIERIVALGDKPVVPASIGRTYKVKRKVLKDRLVKHGPAETGKVAIPKRSKPRKAKATVKRGAGSY